MLNVALARSRREALKLTQEQLSEQLGIDQSTLAKWETGDREPRVTWIRKWARALDLEPGQLLADPEPEPEQPGGAKVGKAAS